MNDELHPAQPRDEGGYPAVTYTFQVLVAARVRFNSNGGSMSSFLSQFSENQDAEDGSYEATRSSHAAPAGVRLYRMLHEYLTADPANTPSGLGLSSEDAASILVTIWSDAVCIKN